MAARRLHFVVVTEDTSREDLEHAMVHLRAKQLRCKLATYRAEISEDLDDLIGLWQAAAPASTPTPA